MKCQYYCHYVKVDLSHLYGETLAKQLALRSMKGGKMKMQMLKGEVCRK